MCTHTAYVNTLYTRTHLCSA